MATIVWHPASSLCNPFNKEKRMKWQAVTQRQQPNSTQNAPTKLRDLTYPKDWRKSLSMKRKTGQATGVTHTQWAYIVAMKKKLLVYKHLFYGRVIGLVCFSSSRRWPCSYLHGRLPSPVFWISYVPEFGWCILSTVCRVVMP